MRIVLHIGTEKTATTSIQRYFNDNRQGFADKGVLYPEKLGGENHLCLPALAIGRHDADEITTAAHALMQRFGYDTMESYIRDTLKRQIAESKPDVLLFSNEHFHSRVKTLEGIERLRKLLSEFSDDIRIILYIRRQDRLAVSYYSTPFKYGKVLLGSAIPKVSARLPHYYDYGKIVTDWSEAFGQDNVDVRIFEEEARSKGGMITSFLTAAGVDAPEHLMPKTHNESLSLEAIYFLANFNEQMAAFPEQNADLRKLRRNLVGFLEKNYPARRKLASRDAARAFYDACRPTNAIVHKAFFPERKTLFDESFDEYGGDEVLLPDAAKLAEIGASAAMAVRLGLPG